MNDFIHQAMIELPLEIIHKLLYDIDPNIFINIIQTNSIFLDVLTKKDIKDMKNKFRIIKRFKYNYKEFYEIARHSVMNYDGYNVNITCYVLPNGHKHGKFVVVANIYGNDLLISGHYKDNLPSGKWVWYNINGFKVTDGYYKKGKETSWWYYTGHRCAELEYGRYENGFKIGYWSSYDKMGNLISDFIQYIEDGNAYLMGRTWEHGKIMEEYHCINHKREGLCKNYRDGYKEEYYINNVLV